MAGRQRQGPEDGTMVPDLVIFDCDGVLIDSEILAAQVHADALARLGCGIGPPSCSAASPACPTARCIR